MARTTWQTRKDFQTNNAAGCIESTTFSLESRKSRSEQMIHDKLYKKNGGPADIWYLDDGNFLCHPMLALPCLQPFDIASGKIGAERNQQETKVIYNVSDLDAALPEWKIHGIRPLAFVDTSVHGHITPKVAVGLCRCITDQLLAKTDVIRSMHERVQQCEDPQTEVALLRERLGVSRINHILRLHGHTILQENVGVLMRRFPALSYSGSEIDSLALFSDRIAFAS